MPELNAGMFKWNGSWMMWTSPPNISSIQASEGLTAAPYYCQIVAQAIWSLKGQRKTLWSFGGWQGGKGRDKQDSGSFAGTVSLNKHGSDKGFISV